MTQRERHDAAVNELSHVRARFTDIESYLNRHLGSEMGPLNVKQSEGILVLIEAVRQTIFTLQVISQSLDEIEDVLSTNSKGGPASEVVLQVGDASLRLTKDGSISIHGGEIRVRGARDISIASGKDLILKGNKITEN